ncbi:acetyl-CoA carboxylase biotin carboxyl carrier protein [Streptomyces sp. NPDC017201]|uniref:acetyl-CoA carboxylase biotin carboxyl carrier protein n=2 Tax=Streptomyces TaxID=1883 RepID=UPI0029A2A829|nr:MULTISPECIES: biotin/lipoyl-containing protein [unclassified Streptomyces]MDX3427860.1 acetyl-CoA carboxylase, biotin carboxyl carrier protein [Streptomyces sp. ME01-18a]MDX3684044.1 acetyl-CoA carboxylase, biotin carboxyl carrier protein [Streptomyces sp. AK04-4c]WSS72217.1 acetyl-CoA carboxylase, biotin carboxyl carrier protein [Streptomyces sp. NBC_01175]
MTTETTTAADTMTVEELRTQTRLLAGELPGTLRRITLKAGGISVDVEWETAPATAPAPTPAAALATAPAGAQPAPAPPAAAPADPDRPAGLVQVTAPLVGTFYQASSPGGEPFVQVGDIVEPGHQLAIIEAMKLLNSITADVRGRVHAVHPQDGEVVEYAQPLFDLVPVD